MSNKPRLYTSDEWRKMYEDSGATSVEIEETVGIPTVVFLRAIQPNGKQIPIPYKYEMPLLHFFRKKITPDIPKSELPDTLSAADKAEKEKWIGDINRARLDLILNQ